MTTPVMNVTQVFTNATEMTTLIMNVTEVFTNATEMFTNATEMTTPVINVTQVFTNATEMTTPVMNITQVFTNATVMTTSVVNVTQVFTNATEITTPVTNVTERSTTIVVNVTEISTAPTTNATEKPVNVTGVTLTTNATQATTEASTDATTSIIIPVTVSTVGATSPTENVTNGTVAVPVTTTTTPTTTVPIVTEVVILGSFRITEGATWEESLSRPDSSAYKTLNDDLTRELTDIYSPTYPLLGIDNMAFRQGSVVVSYQANFNSSMSAKAPAVQQTFLDGLVNGTKLGKYTIDVDSVRHEASTTVPPTTKAPAEESSWLPGWAIAVIVCSCILFVFFIYLIIMLCGGCRRDTESTPAISPKQSERRRQSSVALPLPDPSVAVTGYWRDDPLEFSQLDDLSFHKTTTFRLCRTRNDRPNSLSESYAESLDKLPAIIEAEGQGENHLRQDKNSPGDSDSCHVLPNGQHLEKVPVPEYLRECMLTNVC